MRELAKDSNRVEGTVFLSQAMGEGSGSRILCLAKARRSLDPKSPFGARHLLVNKDLTAPVGSFLPRSESVPRKCRGLYPMCAKNLWLKASVLYRWANVAFAGVSDPREVVGATVNG
jgi:hypothetical protein